MGKEFNYIYKTTNLITGKIYVGQHTSNRLNDAYLGSSQELKKDIRNLGKHNFKKEILEICDYSDLSTKEIEWIINLDAVNLGYNLQIKGTAQKVGFKHSEGTKQIFKERAKEKDISGENNPMFGKTGELNPMYGIHRCGEDSPMFGKKHSEETKQKQREVKLGKYDEEKNPFYGKHHTEESKEKIRESKKRLFEERGNYLKGIPKSDKAKESYKLSWENRKESECPHCGLKSISLSNLKRYHFDNCKFKKK